MAKAAVTAAKNGTVVVRLVAGDPYTSDAVVKEVLAVGRTSVPFDVVPGVADATAVPAFAGVALGSSAVTADLRSGVDLAALAGAVAAGGTLVLQGAAEELPEAAARLIEGGLSGNTPVVVTTGGSGTAQKSVVAKLVAVAEKTAGLDALTGPVVATVGTAVDKRARLSWWESRPLFGWRVLVPRTKDQAGEMSERLRAYGAVPVEVPTIAVEPPRSPAQMDRAIKGLVTGRYGWIVFTSVNAVKAVREKFAELGLDARAFAGVKVACVGEQTADAVRAFGIQPELVPTGEQSSEGLLADFPPYDDVFDPIDRVLLPRADIATETLAAGLKERGWEIDDVTAYRTVRAAPPAAVGARGDQGRRLRRRLLHLVEHGAQPGRHRRQAAREDRRRRDRPGHRRQRPGVRPARRRAAGDGRRRPAGRRPGRVRASRCATAAEDGAEQVTGPASPAGVGSGRRPRCGG